MLETQKQCDQGRGSDAAERRRRGSILAGLLLVLLASGGIWHAGSALTEPVRERLTPPPELQPLEAVEFASAADARIRGWFLPGRPGSGAVLLVHGAWDNRASMAPRAEFLRRAGFAVLLIDLRAHGESTGERITFGYLEAADVRAAVAYLRGRVPGERIGAIGASLGGAAAVLGNTPLQVDALVLEAVYSDIEHAIANRLAIHLGPLGRWLTPLLTLQLRLRLGFGAGALAPVQSAPDLRCPVFVIAGARDQRTTLEETRELFAAVRAPKELWVIPGAGHVDFHHFARREYERRIDGFFLSHLGREQNAPVQTSSVAAASQARR
jgi:fermentation-respiration switch protein FrsA (DUF1100 family)